MGRDLKRELAQLKKEYIAFERAMQEEKESLGRIINTLCVLAAKEEALSEEIDAIKSLVNSPEPLQLEKAEEITSSLKDKILAAESEASKESGGEDLLKNARDEALEACRAIQRIMVVLLEGFYPLTQELETRAAGIHVDCKAIENLRFKEETMALLDFLDGVKEKITADFKYINDAFLVLLEKVKDLEKTFTAQFGSKEYDKKVEYFEMKINGEVNSIANSFDIHTAIDEIKKVVIQKIQNIKQVVSEKKREDLKRAQIARENMKILRERIAEADKHAREMSKRAEALKMVAMKDGLTGLYNRKAFDSKIQDTLEKAREAGEALTIILLDVDRFKEINDTFGHVAGDKILEKVGQSLRETFRENDFLVRYGGDEFVVLIERLTEKMARQRVLNFRKNLAKKRFVSHKKGEITISVSAGIAVARPEDTPESLLDRADQAMYTEKQIHAQKK
ncbi:MAG: GGDEF domain-containing protein [Deltaproteobacteria bacterium]|nr:GGDEF domain-containing protein [Deltaproteobacteria bacterium]